MKLKSIFVIAAVTLISLSSCKKDYACVCSAFGLSGEAEVIENSTKKDAESRCEEIEKASKETVASATCSIEKKD